ncbi:MAG: hypothetical protein ACXVNR_02810 [Bacteroidia bacterium]
MKDYKLIEQKRKRHALGQISLDVYTEFAEEMERRSKLFPKNSKN